MIEAWLPVVGYEGLYEVSNQGRMQSLDRWVRVAYKSGIEAVKFLRGRILKQAPFGTDRKYLCVNLSKDGEQHTVAVQYLVLEAFVGPRPVGMHGCHSDDNGHNNRLTNLRWDTPKGNYEDREKNGIIHHNSLKTKCAQGHDYTPENTRILPSGRRRCRKCAKIWRTRRVAA